jgi:hypothetical protein
VLFGVGWFASGGDAHDDGASLPRRKVIGPRNAP